MANNVVNLTTLDFPSIKNNLKTYLEANSVFKDYDFDSSNINVLLDILSYNTYLQSFYLNMIATEMFLDSAQLDSSIISHAKELNYTPRSRRSAQSDISLIYPVSENVNQIVLPKGLLFSGTNGTDNITYSLSDNISITSSNNTFTANLTIYEGTWFDQAYIYNSASADQRFIVPDANVDSTSITVSVVEDNNSTVLDYSKADSLLDLNANSKVFFLQSTEDSRYEVIFGDGVFGRKPKDQSTIYITYRSSLYGEDGNSCGNFYLAQDVADLNELTQATLPDGSENYVTTNLKSYGGAEKETNRSIKFNAPRHYQTQGRAITVSDYKNLILQNYPNVYDVSIYGGETVTGSIEYGKVFISLNGSNNRTLSNNEKREIQNFIKTKSILGIEPVTTNPKDLFAVVNTNVYYDTSATVKNTSQLSANVRTSIVTYNTNNLELFNNTLRYSKLVETIDDSDTSILSNETNLTLRIKHVPVLNRSDAISIDFNNKITQETFTSSIFTSFDKNYKFVDKIDDVTNNNKYVYKLEININNVNPIYTVVGTIDYETGIVSIGENIITGYQGNAINFDATPTNKDLDGTKNNIIQVDVDNITINVIGDTR